MLRTWGRVNGVWTEVTTDANGNNDYVYITTLCQCIKLSPNESPFYANYGIPAQQSVVTQTYPDYYVNLLQSQFSQYFASLTIQRVPNSSPPIYNVNVLTHAGLVFNENIPT